MNQHDSMSKDQYLDSAGLNFEWVEAELRVAVREAEMLAQHFQRLVAQMCDLSHHAPPLFAVEYSTLVKRRTG